MRILFDPDFDGGAWPGPLADRQATVSESWLGERGLLGQLELRLGLGGAWATPVERVASLLEPVRRIDGFWSRSAAADAVETATSLLRWRDSLWDAGWRGQPLSPRLTELASVTAEIPPGQADRRAAVQEALRRRSPAITSVELLRRAEELPLPWPRILQNLEARGTAVGVRRFTASPATGDLEAVRHSGFAPMGDGSLQLVRTYGPVAASEEVAAWLAAADTLADTVLVGADPTLDRALHDHGLPTTGARAEHHGALLQVLPLAIELGWHPADPARALELLTLAVGPVPEAVASRLIAALREWPAVDSDPWRQALDAGLETIGDASPQRRARRIVDAIFQPAADYGSDYPSSSIRERTAVVGQWLRAGADAADHRDLPWQSAIAQCETLIALLDATPQPRFEASYLQRLVELATRAAPRPRPFAREAGLAAVEHPGAIADGARRIVWWNFTQDSVPPLPRLPLTRTELQALAANGVRLPDPGRLGEDLARRWRRPLLAARESLLLVCPFTAEDGRELFPHPLWDEICSALDRSESTARLEHAVPISHPAVPRPMRSLEPLPEPRRAWTVAAGSIPRREKESPSSAGGLVGCSFKWVGEYVARWRAGHSRALADERQMLGRLAHEILARLLTAEAAPSPAVAETAAGKIFDREAPRWMAGLYLPGADARRALVRQDVCEAARVLAAHLTGHGQQVLAAEERRSRPALGTVLEGRLDLVVGPPEAVIDHKWSGTGYHRGALGRGTAYQLACYSHLLAAGGQAAPPAAYFILRDQKLLATDMTAFPRAERINGPGVATVWTAFERAHAAAWERLQRGELEAPWQDAGQRQDAIDDDGVLVLGPPCRFCDLGALCGAAWEESS